MKRFAGLFLLALISLGMWLPSDSSAATGSPQWRRGRIAWQGNRGRRHNGRWYGYKNYGQWRRSQVGNRRYRMRRVYYWRDGIRLSRFVRVYY